MLDATAAAPATTPARPLGGHPTVTVTLPSVRAGSHTHAKALRSRLQQLLAGLQAGAVHLEALVQQAKSNCIHLLLQGPDGAYFTSWEQFATAPLPWGLGVSPAAIEQIIAERADPKARARAVLRAAHGGGAPHLQLGQQSRRRAADPRTAGAKGPNPSGGSRDYLLARMARDHRPTLEALERGEFPSVVAAARSVGLVTPVLQLRGTPESFARSALATLDESGVRTLIGYLTHPETVPSSQSRAPTGRTRPQPR